MKRILISILLGLAGCTNPQKPREKTVENKLPTTVIATTQSSIDTSYVPLSLKIDNLNTITIKRTYYKSMDDKYRQTFFLNGEKIFTDTVNYLVEDSKYSRIIVEQGKVFLFMECDGRPNLDYIAAYDIDTETKKATFLSSSVFDSNPKSRLKPFTDIDGDGFIEYGGFDLTEAHPHPDSIYYNPSSFYEISHGKVQFDSALVKKQDLKLNGVYLKNPRNISIRKPRL